MLSTCQRKTDHVDDNVRLERTNLRAEVAGLFGSRTVDGHRLHLLPGAIRLIRFALLAADIDHVKPRFHQPGHKISSHMAGATDYDNTHRLPLLRPH